MTQDVYCAMIHGGLSLDFKHNAEVLAKHCCLHNSGFSVDISGEFWNDKNFIPLRQKNSVDQQWDAGCANCENIEKSGMPSFRTGMNDGLAVHGKTNISGPARIDLKFDISCNLACRTCGPQSSTYWQHHLKTINEWPRPIFTPRKKEHVIEALKQLDLSNLRQLVFCGGETLLGQEYWNVAQWLVDNVPNAKEQLTICFQTNGTQHIPKKYFDIIEKTQLVKLHISIDGAQDKFEYLRWPAKWDDTVANIFNIRDTCPSNVMFVIEETISIFNVLYLDETDQWVKQNFSSNREGDIVNHTRHLAHGIYSLDNCSQELTRALKQLGRIDLVPRAWREDADRIAQAVSDIKKFDQTRNQSFATTFPELFDMYKRFW
jgi:sulfatase maturation enzyme AslB (radical SAM superfamily)